MRATLVHNPKAGGGGSCSETLMAALEDAGYSPTYCSIKQDNFSEALKRPAELVIAAGGDGTVARVLTEIPDRDIPIAILPLGTANNIARFFGIGGSLEDIIASWKKAKERQVDIGVAQGPFGERRFVEAVGIGALTLATSRKDRSNAKPSVKIRRGRRNFRKALAMAKPHRVEIQLDDRTVATETLLLEIMNIGRVGPGLSLAPKADPGDGLLDVVLVPPDRRQAVLEWLDDDDDETPAPVVTEQGRRVSVALNGVPFRVGDKFPPATSDAGGVAVELESGRAKVLIPAS